MIASLVIASPVGAKQSHEKLPLCATGGSLAIRRCELSVAV